ncbi:growth-regulating factor 7 [Carica papaya]|uniref:growth-regulating factor 7 n=1 Tax=Carica papaya TaxID=3649 RepID=UPI000B8CF703|nr:growth-regulating factor 7 [Carica papaya]
MSAVTSLDGFRVSDKPAKRAFNSDAEGGDKGGRRSIDFPVKLQRTESFPCKMAMAYHAYNNNNNSSNHHRSFSSHGDDHDRDGDGDGGGPTCTTTTTTRSSASFNSAVPVGGNSGGGAAASNNPPLQPFDISPNKTLAASSHAIFKSPGGTEGIMAAASLGFPFTNAQWNELERQAMIYKYMMASVPVPPDLLFSITRPPPTVSPSPPLGSGLNLRFSSSGDPEPGRCRRTDGKKWRCSRDVAPDQKYCERHMHRGRPRSRKPVELAAANFNNKKTRHCHLLQPSSAVTLAIKENGSSSSSTQFLGTLAQPFHNQTSQFLDKPAEKASNFDSSHRSWDWMMNNQPMPITAPTDHSNQWHNLVSEQTRLGINGDSLFTGCQGSSPATRSYHDEPLNRNSFAKLVYRSEDQVINDSSLLINAYTPRGFIDAWSDEPRTACKISGSSHGKLPLSSLSLTMGGANDSIDGEMGRIQMSLGVTELREDHECNVNKPHLSTWLAPVWAQSSSTPGGPLAEVLRSSTTASNPQSPITRNGDASSPRPSSMSSPSGVLQRTLASVSDSSGCSSPNLGSSIVKPEIALPWLNQDKNASTP